MKHVLNAIASLCVLCAPAIAAPPAPKPNVVFILADDLGCYATTATADHAIECLKTQERNKP